MATVSHPEPNVLALEGEIDLHESPTIREAFTSLIEQKQQQIVVDLNGVNYIDSSGLAVLIDAMQRIQAYGGKFALYGLRESVRTVFEIARLDQVFRIFPDKAIALGAV
ncbi:MAG: anti-sigma factor antagonist [Chthoniobacter sp.]|jgi:anti-sigma B factor antagonist|nr:anti-sigma factor antagonist [Chthoniobacter sp.]